MRTSRILLLTALCALFAMSAGLAQTPPAAPLTTAEFLATLAASSNLPAADLLPPAPTFLSTLCHTRADCARGELCCYPCGVSDCDFVCMKVKRCPLIP